MTQASTKSLNVWLKTHTWIVSLGDPFNRTTSFNAYLLWRFQAATPPPLNSIAKGLQVAGLVFKLVLLKL